MLSRTSANTRLGRRNICEYGVRNALHGLRANAAYFRAKLKLFALCALAKATRLDIELLIVHPRPG